MNRHKNNPDFLLIHDLYMIYLFVNSYKTE